MMLRLKEKEVDEMLYRWDAPFRLALGENRELVMLALADGGSRILDLGAGTGFITLEAAKRIGDTGEIVAVDIVDSFIDILRKKAEAMGVAQRIRTVISVADNLPLPDAYFDAVVSCSLFHEIDNLAGVFAEVRRVLKPGGKFVFSDFRRLPDPVKTEQIEAWYARQSDPEDEEVHLRYSIEEVRDLLELNRFTRIDINPWVEYHMRGVAFK
ncbi:MAG: class I SAM-dependent methyltransferase [Bacillota bacterium]